jgi:hypothetical protein
MKQTSQPVQSVSGEDLLAALQLASSQDVQAMQMGSEQFKRMREMTGVHDGLHEIALRKDLPIEIRKMAAVQFKNLVVSHWRARRSVLSSLVLAYPHFLCLGTCLKTIAPESARERSVFSTSQMIQQVHPPYFDCP